MSAVEQLEIQINAEAGKANDAIGKLASKLDVLQNSLSNLSGANFNSFSVGVKNLSSAMQGLSTVKLPDYTRLGKGIEKLGALDSATITGAGQAISKLAVSLNVLDSVDISDNAKQMAELATGISKLGYKSSTKAIENIPKLATAMRDLMGTLSTAPKVSQNLIDMTNALAKLARTGASSGKAATSLSTALNTYSSSAVRSTSHTFSLASALGKLYASYWVVFRAFGKIGDAIDIASDLTEVQNVVDVTFGNMAYKVEEFAETSIEQFGLSELSLKEFASTFQAMGSAMNIDSSSIEQANKYLNQQTNGYIGLSDSLSDVSLNLTKLTADMASFYNMEQKDVAEDLQAIFTGQVAPLRRYGLELTQANLSQWALSQGMDANIKSMTGAEKAMLRYQYVLAHTGASQNDFSRTVNTWSNQVRILKQNFQQLGAVIGGTFINALKPLVQALNSVMGKLIEFAKTVSNSLGKIFGWKYEDSTGGMVNDFDSVSDATGDIEGNLGGAADKAKKMRSYLLGIDELNVIEPDDDTGTGSGSGSGSGLGDLGAGAGGGNWVKTDSILEGYESELDTLYKLGEYIGKALTDVLNGIDWEKVYEGARNFGTGLADFLNGLISPELFGAVGRTIAGALNTAVYASLSFAERFDWSSFGLSIATGINEFFNTFDFKSLAKSINAWAKGILDTIITVIDKTDWYKIGTKIGEFLLELDFLEIGIKVGEAIWKAINAGFEVLEGMFETAPLETAILGLGTVLGKMPSIIKKITGTKLAAYFIDVGKNAKSLYITISGSLSPALSRMANAFAMSTAHGATFTQGLGASWTALQRIMSTISPVTKGLIGISTAFAEFAVVKDAISDIVLGVGNLSTNLVQLGTAAGVAGAALSVVFGFPAGVIAAGVTAAVGAIAGLNSAFDQIDAERLGLSIKNALTVPGGVPLDSIVDGVRASISSVGESFTFLSEQSAGLSTANGNIKSVWQEIEKIETSMREGVTSVEEGTAQLTAQFEILAQTANEKFTSIENTLLAAYGENGALNTALERIGVSAGNVVGEMLELSAEASQRMSEISAELATLDPSNPKYAELKTELAGLIGTTDELTSAMQSGASEINAIQIDFSKLIPNEEGVLDTGYFESTMGSLVQTVTDTQAELDTGMETLRTALQEGLNTALAMGDDSAVAEFQAQLDALPQAMSTLKTDIGTEALGVSDALQTQLIGNIDTIISDAEARWEGMTWTEKLFTGFDNSAEYAANAVEQYKTGYIDPLSASIDEQFSQLGIDGAGWGSEATQTIIDSLFDPAQYSGGMVVKAATLNENYTQVIEGATSGLSELAATRGSEVIEGFNTGLDDNVSSSETSVSSWMDAVDKAIHDSVMAFGSPSQRTWDYAKDTIDGYNNGILENMATTQSVIAQWMESINSAFMGEGESSMFSGIVTSLQATWEEADIWWTAEMERWHAENVLPWFDSEKWMLVYASIKTSLQATWDETLVWWDAAIYRWYNDDVAPYFTKEKWTWPGIKDGLVASFEAATEACKQVWNTFAQHMNQNMKMTIDPIVVDGQTVFSGQTINLGTWPTFANGGFPDVGDIFIANEVGPELIGTIGGRPAVASNNEITGIRDAVYDSGEVNAQLLNTVIELLQIVASKDLTVSIGDRDIVEANRRGEARMGYRFT